MKLMNTITRFGGKIIFLGKKYAPEILMVAGTAATVAGTVMACKATLKVDDILDEHKDSALRINQTYEKSKNGTLTAATPYTATDRKKDLTKLYVMTGVKMAKTFGPAIALEAAGIACWGGACGIFKGRFLGAAAAYAALDDQFSQYRERVIEDRGEAKDQEYMYGLKAQEFLTTETKENGAEVTETKTVMVTPDGSDFDEYVKKNGYSPYAKIFDSCNPNWTKDPSANNFFLRGVEQAMTDKLLARGYVFLDEVLVALGFPATKASKQVGWLLGRGDDKVSFNIVQVYNSRFVNGYEPSCVIDFNVDGVILADAPIENI